MFKTIKGKISLIVLLMLPMISLSGAYIYRLNDDVHSNDFVKLMNSRAGVRISNNFEKNVIQIQQWLTDISATRGAEGFDDGYKEAAAHFEKAMSDLSFLKEKKYLSDEDYTKIVSGLSDFYTTGKKMADLYVKEGPIAGNAFMEQFDTKSETLQAAMDPVLKRLNSDEDDSLAAAEKNLLHVNQFVLITFLVLIIYVSGGLFLLGRSIMKVLGTTTQKIVSNAQKLDEESSAVTTLSNTLSEASTQQAASLQQTVSSVNEISSMVNRNAEAANQSTQVSRKSMDAANEGKRVVDVMKKSIGDISKSNESIMTEVSKSNDEISQIVEMISEIGEKTQVINDIVFQTKLLSFNASVEAARAGEAGKGFAVVAEEIGKLAASSGNASLEISEMLDSSISQVKEIVTRSKNRVGSLIDEGKNRVELGVVNATKCGDALAAIIRDVEQMNQMMKEISNASSEQALGVNEVNTAMHELDSVTNQTSSISIESARMAKKLQSQSQELKRAIGELRELMGEEAQEENVAPKLMALQS